MNENLERRIITLEQTVVDLKRLISLAQAEAAAGLEKIRFLRSENGSGCLTTLQGRIVGFDTTALPLPGSQVQITGSSSGIDYGTFDVPTGNFTLPLYLDPRDGLFRFTVIGPAPRFKPTVISRSLGVAHCGSVSLGNFQAAMASGYKVITGTAYGTLQFPVSEHLNWENSLYGTGTMSSSGGGIWTDDGCQIVVTFPYTQPPSTSCPSVSTPLKFALYHDGTSTVVSRWGLIGCVPAGTCSDSMSPAGIPGVLTSRQDPGLSQKFDWTFTILGGTNTVFHGPSDQTYRVYEP